MTRIEYVTSKDKAFWYSLDKHLLEKEFENKVAGKQGYVLFAEDRPVGLLRYNLFWDNTSFCTMLFIDWQEQHKGYGKQLLKHWEEDMKAQGYGMVLTMGCEILIRFSTVSISENVSGFSFSFPLSTFDISRMSLISVSR